MVEFILIFGLGALSATLVFLLALPLLWQRAVRLSTRRLEMQLPLSMTEIYAERDQLRAQAAVEMRKIEMQLQNCEEHKAVLMSDIGRKMNEVAIAHKDVQNLRERLEAADRRIKDMGHGEADHVREALHQMGQDVVALFQKLEADMGTAACREALENAQGLLKASRAS